MANITKKEPNKLPKGIVTLIEDNKKDLHIINKAPHYNTGKYEVIEVAEDWGIDKDAYIFNTFKYIARAGKKDKDKLLEDLEKASYYLLRRINKLKKDKL